MLTPTLLLGALLPFAAGLKVTLPSSTAGQVRVLVLESAPVARSYDGALWERTQGGATLELECDGDGVCIASFPDGASYQIETDLQTLDDTMVDLIDSFDAEAGRAMSLQAVAISMRASCWSVCHPHRSSCAS